MHCLIYENVILSIIFLTSNYSYSATKLSVPCQTLIAIDSLRGDASDVTDKLVELYLFKFILKIKTCDIFGNNFILPKSAKSE